MIVGVARRAAVGLVSAAVIVIIGAAPGAVAQVVPQVRLGAPAPAAARLAPVAAPVPVAVPVRVAVAQDAAAKDFVADAAPAPALVAPKAPDKDTGMDPKKKYRAILEPTTLTVVEVDKNGNPGDTVLEIPAPTAGFGFSPDGQRLIAFNGLSIMDLYDLSTRNDKIWSQNVEAVYGFSPKGGYLAQRTGSGSSIRLVVFDVASHHTDSIASGVDVVGFAPGDKAILVQGTDNSATLYQLPGLADTWSRSRATASSTYGFSPEGTYLLQRTVTAGGVPAQQFMEQAVFDATATGAGARVYQADFVFGLVPILDVGAEESGFGPHGGVLVEAHTNPNADSSSVFVTNLTTGKVVYSDGAAPGGTAWAFSPCGDAFAVVGPNGPSQYNLALVSTTSGTRLGFTQIPAGTFKLQATEDSFTVTDSKGDKQTLAPNPHGLDCVDAPVAALDSVSLKDQAVPSGGSTAGTVALSAAVSPGTVTIPAGETSATFDVTAAATATKATVTITATLAGTSKSTTLTVNPPQVTDVTLSPDPVIGGRLLTATITLDGTAPPGGTVATLSSDNDAVAVPATITVPAGDNSGKLTLTTTATDGSPTVTVTATTGTSHASATVTVAPLQVTSITITDDPKPISSDVTAIVATVHLNGSAPVGGHAVTLTSSDAALLAAPASLTVPEGASSVAVTLTPTPIPLPDDSTKTGERSAVITASDSGSANLTVALLPPVSLNYANFEGAFASAGSGADLMIALNRAWNMAVEGNSKTVTLRTDKPNLVSLPILGAGHGIVVTETSDDDISEATWESTVPIAVRPVAEPTTATVTVSIGDSTEVLTLNINPPRPGTIFTIAGDGMSGAHEVGVQPGDTATDPLRTDLCGCVAEVASPVKDVVVAPDGTVYASYTSPDTIPGYHPAGIPSGIAVITASGLIRYADLTGQLDLADPADSHIRSGQMDLDQVGNLYVSTGHSVLKVSPGGTVTTVPGSDGEGTIADVTVGPDGVLYLADWTNDRVWKLGPDGVPTGYVGTGDYGSSGDGAAATDAQIGRVYLDMSPMGVLYLGDIDHHVLRMVSPDGEISTIAGTGTAGIARDGDDASDALVDDPNPMGTPGGGVLFSDETVVQFLSPNGSVYRIAGQDTRSFLGDGGNATSAGLSRLGGVAVDGSGNVYLADAENSRVREVAIVYQLFDVPPVIVAGETSFGDVPVGAESDSHTLTLTNTADWPVMLTGLDAADQWVDGSPIEDFRFSSDTCTGITLAPAQSCTVDVTLRPLGSYQRHGVLRVGLGATGTQPEYQYSLDDLDGTGVAPLSVAPASVAFPATAVGSQTDWTTLTVTNNSGAELALTDAVAGDQQFIVGTNTCVGTLGSGLSCAVDIAFAPASGGSQGAQLDIVGPSPIAGDVARVAFASVDLTGAACAGSGDSGGSPDPTSGSGDPSGSSDAPSGCQGGGGGGSTDTSSPTDTTSTSPTNTSTTSSTSTTSGTPTTLTTLDTSITSTTSTTLDTPTTSSTPPTSTMPVRSSTSSVSTVSTKSTPAPSRATGVPHPGAGSTVVGPGGGHPVPHPGSGSAAPEGAPLRRRGRIPVFRTRAPVPRSSRRAARRPSLRTDSPRVRWCTPGCTPSPSISAWYALTRMATSASNSSCLPIWNPGPTPSC